MNRREILAEASRLISEDRSAAYGPADEAFARIAALWSAYLNHKVTAIDALHMMALLKISRTRGGPARADNWVDGAGYLALAAEIGLSGKK